MRFPAGGYANQLVNDWIIPEVLVSEERVIV
jgi:hypothetical protein